MICWMEKERQIKILGKGDWAGCKKTSNKAKIEEPKKKQPKKKKKHKKRRNKGNRPWKAKCLASGVGVKVYKP